MSSHSTNPAGCAGWLKWLVGTIIALLAAGSGIVALLTYLDSNSPQPTPRPAPPPSQQIAYEPDTAYISVNSIQLPQNADIPIEIREGIASLIVQADIAEINAFYYEDDSYLKPHYTGNALYTMQNEIEALRQQGVRARLMIDIERSYYADMRYVSDRIIAIDACEYWKTDYYGRENGEFLTATPWELVPQTINMELMDQGLYITSLSFYETNAFCTM